MAFKELKPFQEIGVAFLSTTPHALLADDMGLGKTLQAVRAMDVINALSVLIVCPANVRFTWLDAVAFDSESYLKPVILKGTMRPRETNFMECWICSYEFVVGNLYYFQGHKFDLLICDEAHYLRRLSSKRTQAVLGRWGVASKCGFKWMLSGTPIHNRPIDLFPILCTMALARISPQNTFDSFARRYCGGPLALGASSQKELKNKLTGFMLRRAKKEVLPELPPCTTEIIWINYDATAKLREVVKAGSEIQMRVDTSGKPDTKTFGEMARHRQDLAIAKIPFVITQIENILEYEKKLVVFVYHMAVLEAFRKTFNGRYDFALYCGAMSLRDKERAKKKFTSGKEVRLFFGQIIAAGTGLDGLQRVCSTVLFAEWDWTPGGNSQATDRLHRMGQENPVTAQFIAVRGSLEERMLTSNAAKKKNQQLILNTNGE